MCYTGTKKKIFNTCGVIICVNCKAHESCAILNKCYSFGGRKFEHALKHGLKNGLSIVTIGWFVDSVRKNGKRGQCIFSALVR